MRIDPTDIELCLFDESAPTSTGSMPMTVPIVMTSLFTFPTLEALQAGLAAEDRTHVYTRGSNPTVGLLEHKLAALERGESCKCVGSGMAAVSAVMLGVLRAGDHILFVNQTYGPTIQLARHLESFGITHTRLYDCGVEAVRAALQPNTRLVWLESPGTMTFGLVDLAAISAIARERGILTCIDNSWSTPLLQKPITQGIDLVVHSCSKYINGHSDVMAGAIIGSAKLMKEIFFKAYMLQGGIMTPHDAWLVLRGLRTMPARLRQHEADALTVAHALRGHPLVRQVLHPAVDANQSLIDRQMTGYSGVFAFELVKDDVESIRRFVNSLRHFKIGVSWGGVESLVIAPANGHNETRLAEQHIPRGTIRLSIGLEGADLLVADLTNALAQLT